MHMVEAMVAAASEKEVVAIETQRGGCHGSGLGTNCKDRGVEFEFW
jgi:hypothetical protein